MVGIRCAQPVQGVPSCLVNYLVSWLELCGSECLDSDAAFNILGTNNGEENMAQEINW